MRRFSVLKLAAISFCLIIGLTMVGFWNIDLFTASSNQNPVDALTFAQDPGNAPAFPITSTVNTRISSTDTASARSPNAQVNSSNDRITLSDPICRPNPLDHVYTPSRLQVLEVCKTVTGNIESIRPELDGDFHIGLRPDPQFANVVNDCNRSCLFGLERGRLVVEVVCVFHPVFPESARQTCEGFRSAVSFPFAHVHVSVTGTFVKDLDHGWLEIHPAWEIKQIS